MGQRFHTIPNGLVMLAPQVIPIRDGLLGAGFLEERLRSDFPIPGMERTVPLLAFADRPFDSRTASVAVVQGPRFGDTDIAALRPLGAPLVFACLPDHFQFWSQGAARPIFRHRLTECQLSRFFDEHRQQFSPDAIYRAKIWGRLDPCYQLDFVDAGLMPLVEEEAGRKLTELIERTVRSTKKQLGWSDNFSDADGRWLLKSVFWLVAAKILHDKDVPGFIRLALTDVKRVYEQLAKHYNGQAPQPVRIGSRAKQDALVAAAGQIETFGHCGCVTTEALAYVYESALIDRVTRSKLGTHSTPTWLVDYMVGRLRPWIRGIPVPERRVFEPACGHAGFLISAMRLLSELLPADWREPRRTYLRKRLYGIEKDPFALEIARLSLTLADVPNPNGWALTEANMFAGDCLESGVRNAKIVLGNPPFENFPKKDHRQGWLPNKAAETFRRVVENLPPGGVFGFVLPQTFLRSKQATEVRQLLLRDYEIAEVSLFADKVFRYGEPESAVLIGRRLMQSDSPRSPIRYQRIRERQIKEFGQTYHPSSSAVVSGGRFASAKSASFLVSELAEVWESLTAFKKLNVFADIGKGFDHKGDDDPSLPPDAIKISAVLLPGLVYGFAGWLQDQMTHLLPKGVWLNLSPEVTGAERRGTTVGMPQVLLNYGRVSREAWRLKAILDSQGHPVTSRFVVLRPTIDGVSLQSLWAILNSPIGNAYSHCMSGKRDVLAGDIRQMPVPDLTECDLSRLEQAVADYLTAAQSISSVAIPHRQTRVGENASRQTVLDGMADLEVPDLDAARERLKILHWQIDAEVLRLYDLPAELERKVLDLFSGVRRRGVPFEQTEYFPKGFTELDRLSDLLAITEDWPKTNRRRAKLIDLEEEDRLTPQQAEELENLQRLTDARVTLLRPVQMEGADGIIEDLKRRGLWQEQNRPCRPMPTRVRRTITATVLPVIQITAGISLG